MNYLEEFDKIMTDQAEIALATSIDNIPNVRIVNFYCNPEKKGVLYFSSFKNNPKTVEFSKNRNVAFSSVPRNGQNEHIRVTTAVVSKSKLTIYDLKKEFVSRVPDYEMIIDQAGDQLNLYELKFREATVIVDMNNISKIRL